MQKRTLQKNPWQLDSIYSNCRPGIFQDLLNNLFGGQGNSKRRCQDLLKPDSLSQQSTHY